MFSFQVHADAIEINVMLIQFYVRVGMPVSHNFK